MRTSTTIAALVLALLSPLGLRAQIGLSANALGNEPPVEVSSEPDDRQIPLIAEVLPSSIHQPRTSRESADPFAYAEVYGSLQIEADQPHQTGVYYLAGVHFYEPGAIYEWMKDGKPIVGGQSFSIPQSRVRLSDAGTYQVRLRLGGLSHLSAPVSVGVVRGGLQMHPTLREGASIKLTQVAAGSNLSFRWYHHATPLEDQPGKVEGSSTSILHLHEVGAASAGTYFCYVQSTEQGPQSELVGTVHYVPVAILPILHEPVMPSSFAVGREVSIPLSGDFNVTRFEVQGLPRGLRLDPVTQRIVGRPTHAGTYQTRIRARNKNGASAWRAITIVVEGLTPSTSGTFIGLVGRVNAEDPGFGGRIKFTISSTATLTGNVDFGTRRYSFTGRLNNESEANPYTYIRLFHNHLILFLNVDPASGAVLGTVALSDGSAQLAVEAKQVLPLRSNIAPLTWQGTHPVSLKPEAFTIGNPIYPQGDGAGKITVRHNGSYAWTGHLSDGSAYTMAGQLTIHGGFAAQTLLYGKRGSIQGWLEVLEPHGQVNGFLEWMKYHQAGSKSFPTGFPLHSLDVMEN
jgi:hypothetical protein